MRAGWLLLFLLMAALTGAESLWAPGSKGYYSGVQTLHQGDFLHVVLTGEASLSFKTVRASNQAVSLDFGNAAGLSLPPGATSGGEKLAVDSQWKVKDFSLTVRVVSVDPSGVAQIEGRRTLHMSGGVDTLTLTGTVDPQSVQGQTVAWQNVADLNLVYTSAAATTKPVVTAQDYGPDHQLTKEKQEQLKQEYLNRFLSGFFSEGTKKAP